MAFDGTQMLYATVARVGAQMLSHGAGAAA